MSTHSLTADDPRVIAFARGWTPDPEGHEIELLRARVAEAGVELIIVGERGVWVFEVDGRVDHVDRLAGDLPVSASMYQARSGDAVFLIDDGTVVRIAYDGTISDAVTGCAEMLAMKSALIVDAPRVTMPNGLFASVFESNYAEYSVELP